MLNLWSKTLLKVTPQKILYKSKNSEKSFLEIFFWKRGEEMAVYYSQGVHQVKRRRNGVCVKTTDESGCAQLQLNTIMHHILNVDKEHLNFAAD